MPANPLQAGKVRRHKDSHARLPEGVNGGNLDFVRKLKIDGSERGEGCAEAVASDVERIVGIFLAMGIHSCKQLCLREIVGCVESFVYLAAFTGQCSVCFVYLVFRLKNIGVSVMFASSK